MEITYPAYELPSWQARALTQAQYDKLSLLCERYNVPFDPTHYRVWSDDASMTKGFAEGWVGGIDYAPGNDQGNRSTIYIGVEPNGDSHS